MGDEPGTLPPPREGRGALFYCLLFGCLFLVLGGIGSAIVFVFVVRKAAEYLPTDDPVKVQASLQSILPSQIPAGYQGVSMKIPGGYEFVMVLPQGQLANQQPGSDPDLPLLMVVCKFPPGKEADEVKREIKKMLANQQGKSKAGQLEVESGDGTLKQEIVIRGEAVGIEQTIGNTKDGERFKQVFLAIPRTKGSDEVAFLMAVGEEKAFDEAAFKAYIESIR